MITDLVTASLKILEKVIPDPAAKAEAQYKLLALSQSGDLAQLEADLKLALAQTETNSLEAQSADPFVRRWRPAVGWVCCLGLVWQFLAGPLLGWISPLAGLPAPPALDLGDLITLLTGLLGLSGLRTWEKLQGKA